MWGRRASQHKPGRLNWIARASKKKKLHKSRLRKQATRTGTGRLRSGVARLIYAHIAEMDAKHVHHLTERNEPR